MEVKTFYTSQVEIASALCEIIDSYLNSDIDEEFMISSINKIILNNQDKVFKDDGFTAAIKQRCGKRRLEIISKVLNLADCKN